MLLLIFINEADYLQTKMLPWLKRKGRMFVCRYETRAHCLTYEIVTVIKGTPGTCAFQRITSQIRQEFIFIYFPL